MTETAEFIAPHPLDTPVLLLVFNRLNHTKEVLKNIGQAKPPRLYIAADGARADREGEAERVQAVREYILDNIDWECEVKTLFRDENLGCKYAVSSAITWFFENEEQGIILEDDCLTSQSFFWYCEELLEKYKEDKSIYLVAGDNRGPEHIKMKEDYGYCKYPIIWGWASWADIWKKYSAELDDWPQYREELTPTISKYKSTQKFWMQVFDKMYNKEVDTWDYQFVYLLLKNKGKCIVPRLNQVSNIGFGADATHTIDQNSENDNRPRYEFTFPLSHVINSKSEESINKYFDTRHFHRSKRWRIINKIKRHFLELFGIKNN